MDVKEIKANLLLQLSGSNVETLATNLAQAYADLDAAKKKIAELEAKVAPKAE